MNRHHAFVIEAGAEEGIEVAQAWAKKELGMHIENNPDIVVMRYGLLSVADARRVTELAAGAPFAGKHKVIIVVASRAYHEAQNALLKLFEEPPPGTYLFLVLSTVGGLLPTLRSRVQILGQKTKNKKQKTTLPEATEQFLKASREKRSALIKKVTAGKDEEERRELREEAIALLNGIEAVAYESMKKGSSKTTAALLSDISTLRGHLYDRSAPVRMILEHLSLVIPKDLI
jgi:DNA polymerase III delta prime subunit